jgi:hypothetical protein
MRDKRDKPRARSVPGERVIMHAMMSRAAARRVDLRF